MRERTLRGMALGIDGETDGAELHGGNGMVPITTLWSRRQTDDVARLSLCKYPLE